MLQTFRKSWQCFGVFFDKTWMCVDKLQEVKGVARLKNNQKIPPLTKEEVSPTFKCATYYTNFAHVQEIHSRNLLYYAYI